MKIFYSYSARGSEEFGTEYKMIGKVIEDLGHVRINENDFVHDPKEVYAYSHKEMTSLYKKSVKALKDSDVVVLEVSKHSLSIGYVMHISLDLGKPVIALYLQGREPVFVTGIENDKLQVLEYSAGELREVLENALGYAVGMMDTRFNFFISPKIGTYLDWISKKKRLPRAVYLRRLIEEDMKQSGYEG